MSAASRQKNRDTAAYMKEKKIARTSGSCPMGCGSQITNGGAALMAHLGRCGRKN